MCAWQRLHKRDSAGFLGSGNINYVNTASGSTSSVKWWESTNRGRKTQQGRREQWRVGAVTSSG